LKVTFFSVVKQERGHRKRGGIREAAVHQGKKRGGKEDFLFQTSPNPWHCHARSGYKNAGPQKDIKRQRARNTFAVQRSIKKKSPLLTPESAQIIRAEADKRGFERVSVATRGGGGEGSGTRACLIFTEKKGPAPNPGGRGRGKVRAEN